MTPSLGNTACLHLTKGDGTELSWEYSGGETSLFLPLVAAVQQWQLPSGLKLNFYYLIIRGGWKLRIRLTGLKLAGC